MVRLGALLATMRLTVYVVRVRGVTCGLACCLEGRKEFRRVFLPFLCRFILALEGKRIGNRFRYSHRERGVLRAFLLFGHSVGYLCGFGGTLGIRVLGLILPRK
jgi:hypothetical protein